MRFQPKSEADLQAERDKSMGIWPNGVYDFEVGGAEETTSKAGNDMLVLTIHVFNKEGDRKVLRDYLLESMAYKLRHAAYACGLTEQYESGVLNAEDFIGRTGSLRLGMEKGTEGFPGKNRVTDYEKRRQMMPRTPASREKKPADDLNDDIPF